MTIQLIFFELAIGLIVLGAFLAYKRSMGERLCLLGSVVIAYLLAFLITKIGVFDGIADFILMTLSLKNKIGIALSSSTIFYSCVKALVATLIRPFFMTVIFLLLCVVFKIVVSILIKFAKLEQKYSLFRVEENEQIWKKIVSCVIGAITCYSIFMLAYLPIASIENLAKPAIETVKSEQYSGTFVQEVANIADEKLMPTGGHSAFGALQKLTGFGAVLKGTANSLSNTTVVIGENQKIKFNSTELLQDVICSGADATAIYEFTCRPDEYTFGDMKPAANILARVSNHEILWCIALEYMNAIDDNIEPVEQELEYESLSTQLASVLKENYTCADIAKLQDDLRVMSNLVNVLTTDLKDANLRKNDLLPVLFDYLSSENGSYTVVNELSSMHTYEQTVDILAEYGLNVLCDKLNISENKQDYYNDYLESAYTTVNTRTDGDYYIDNVEEFIIYAAENNIIVADYKISDTENPSEIDFAYMNYANYFSQAQRFEELFANYLLDDKKASSYYVMSDGIVYVFKADESIWKLASSEDVIKTSSFAAQLLSIEVKDKFVKDIEYTITKDDIKVMSATLISRLENSNTVVMSEEIYASTINLLRSLISIDTFAPNNAVYRTDILSSLKKGNGMDQSQNNNFANIVATAAMFGKGIYGKTDTGMSLYIDSFDLIGRLLDNLQKMEKTSDVPKNMLLAITQHKDYGKYFLSDSIIELSENVQNGSSTYEELFTSVQALYNIVNQVVSN